MATLLQRAPRSACLLNVPEIQTSPVSLQGSDIIMYCLCVVLQACLLYWLSSVVMLEAPTVHVAS